ncbi:hypothetical protein BDV25DRAFT_157310 [Aspergillus avenaceus]|uniref:Zn(2)-C6 fungal-type domain-containing protein n=1 Tax=Aspergillus avenaceus TaxID=36643 RepID=A0A5N6TRC9_ASPAV|nr:hypothetical protein BDV25DRAFT_157310 [Aspergillus avenaceus]
MPGVPSNKACERCKKRHLKCDETRPKCQRCINAGVECPGYVQMRKFIDQGASVRRRYAPYHENNPNAHSNRLAKSMVGERILSLNGSMNGHDNHSQAGPVISSPSNWTNNEPMQLEVRSPLPPLPSSGSIANRRTISTPANGLSVDQPQSLPSTSAGHSPLNQNNLHNGNRSRPPSSNAGPGSPSQHSERDEFQDIFSELMTGTEHEIAFLIRHYSENLGPWLDISDSAKFFEVYVPIRAINDQYLRFAIAALAAKHLGRMKGAKSPAGGGLFTRPATMEMYPNAAQVDWFLKATNYYILAAIRMNSSISETYTSASSSTLLESPIQIANRWLSVQLKQSSSPLAEGMVTAGNWRKTENIFAAITIMTMYKLMDEPGENWRSHLSGVRQLFDSLLHLHNSTSTRSTFPQGARAAFWNFARLDYMGSYIARLSTQLDQENFTLWRAAGILIDDLENFSLQADLVADKTLSQEDLAANSLIWLVTKVINFLAESKKSQWEQLTGHAPSEPSTPSPPATSATSYPSTSTWLKLSFDFQTWMEGLPETFRPCLRLDHPKDLSKMPEISYMPFPEIFYSLTSCAATMQQYHFGRLALSLNRPPDAVSGPSTAFDRLQGYRELMKETDYRCREICGIALGRPKNAARVCTVPILFAVGQCFENPEERQIVVGLLRGIEADLGWETSFRVEKLHALWDQR